MSEQQLAELIEAIRDVAASQREATAHFSSRDATSAARLSTFETARERLVTWHSALRLVMESSALKDAVEYARMEEAAAFAAYSALVGAEAVEPDLRYALWTGRKPPGV
jgi:hypothetical protein